MMRRAWLVLVAVFVASPVVAQEASPAASEALPLTTSVAALALEAAIPTNVAGLELATVSFSGEDIVARAGADDPVAQLQAIATAAGVPISDLSLASGTADDGERFIGILAARLGGVPASEFAPALTPLVLETTDGTAFELVMVSDHELTQVGPGTGLTGDALVYVLERGDTAWYIVADVELLGDVLDALP